MNLIACLIWYDEHPDDLHRSITSLKGFADGLVALDGAFEHFPDGSRVSPFEQHQAIIDACDEAGVACSIHTPAEIWPNEPTKRTAAFQKAGWLKADWVWGHDADMAWDGDSERARRLLDGTTLRAACAQVDSLEDHRIFFRWSRGLRCERAHYIVRDDEGVLFAPIPYKVRQFAEIGDPLPALDDDAFFFEHFPRRDHHRTQRAADYYGQRDRLGIESIVSVIHCQACGYAHTIGVPVGATPPVGPTGVPTGPAPRDCPACKAPYFGYT